MVSILHDVYKQVKSRIYPEGRSPGERKDWEECPDSIWQSRSGSSISVFLLPDLPDISRGKPVSRMAFLGLTRGRKARIRGFLPLRGRKLWPLAGWAGLLEEWGECHR